jgi:hypothetical protein
VIFDLLMHPGKISMTVLYNHCSAIWNGMDDVRVQKQIKSNMMGVCLLNSVSPSVSQRLEADKDKWFFTN